jgi:hypothetical protein
MLKHWNQSAVVKKLCEVNVGPYITGDWPADLIGLHNVYERSALDLERFVASFALTDISRCKLRSPQLERGY